MSTWIGLLEHNPVSYENVTKQIPLILQKWILKYITGGSQVQKCLLYFVCSWVKQLV